MEIKRLRELPIISTVLVAVNIIVFLICTFTGDLLYNIGRLDAYSVLVETEYWRIFGAMFLHADWNHIFNNMIILFFLGSMIEKEIGHISFAVAYLLSGIGGNMLSLVVKIVTGDASGSVGASGAVFGLDGVLLALILFSTRHMPTVTPIRVILMIVLSLYSGFTGTNIDNGAHVGGLIVGFLCGTFICIVKRCGHTKPENQDLL